MLEKQVSFFVPVNALVLLLVSHKVSSSFVHWMTHHFHRLHDVN